MLLGQTYSSPHGAVINEKEAMMTSRGKTEELRDKPA
jgi:hypothetical protein